MFRFCFVSVLLAGLPLVPGACSGSPEPPREVRPPVQKDSLVYRGFYPSDQKAPAPGNMAGNWCYQDFKEAVLINVVPDNSNQRYFKIREGEVLKVNVLRGKIISAVTLRGQLDGIEVFTSDQLPECMSNADNFSFAPEGLALLYDNGPTIQFTLTYREAQEGKHIVLESPVGMSYPMTVYRCRGCN